MKVAVQQPEHRARKGAVVVVEVDHSYNKVNTLERVEYSTVHLDRVDATSARKDRHGMRLVTRLRIWGEVKAPISHVLLLDKPVRAEELWTMHSQTVWQSLTDARDSITEFVEKP